MSSHEAKTCVNWKKSATTDASTTTRLHSLSIRQIECMVWSIGCIAFSCLLHFYPSRSSHHSHDAELERR